MNLTAFGFWESKKGYELRSFLNNRITVIEELVKNTDLYNRQMQQDKNFKLYATNLLSYYVNVLRAFKENDKAELYEKLVNSLKNR